MAGGVKYGVTPEFHELWSSVKSTHLITGIKQQCAVSICMVLGQVWHISNLDLFLPPDGHNF